MYPNQSSVGCSAIESVNWDEVGMVGGVDAITNSQMTPWSVEKKLIGVQVVPCQAVGFPCKQISLSGRAWRGGRELEFGKSRRGLSKRGLGPKGANRTKKLPFRWNFCCLPANTNRKSPIFQEGLLPDFL